MIKINRKRAKHLHQAGVEPAAPAVLRLCHNQLDHWSLIPSYAYTPLRIPEDHNLTINLSQNHQLTDIFRVIVGKRLFA